MAGPLYRQIADALRHKIASGQLEPGGQLATEDELMAEYYASRNTVRGALRELTTRGLVYTLHGKGTFVTERVSPIVSTLTNDPRKGGGATAEPVYMAELAASGRLPVSEEFRVEIRKASPGIAMPLRIAVGTEVICRKEKLFVNNQPWSIQTSYYPRILAERAPRLMDGGTLPAGTVDYMSTCGIQQVGFRDAIEVRVPSEEETVYFGLPVDGHILVFEIYCVAFSQNHERIRLTTTAYRADRNRFVINVGDVPSSDKLITPDTGHDC